MDLEITLQVNGATRRLSIDTRTTLLDALLLLPGHLQAVQQAHAGQRLFRARGLSP
jgi:aerobic-type carbon monoxide dehydrogenase small subunit (CoxS/CutS family)